jgi:hypothetical protein
VQLSGFGMSARARCDTRVNANDLWATDDPLVSCFPFSKVLGDISMDPEYAESTLCRQLC